MQKIIQALELMKVRISNCELDFKNIIIEPNDFCIHFEFPYEILDKQFLQQVLQIIYPEWDKTAVNEATKANLELEDYDPPDVSIYRFMLDDDVWIISESWNFLKETTFVMIHNACLNPQPRCLGRINQEEADMIQILSGILTRFGFQALVDNCTLDPDLKHRERMKTYKEYYKYWTRYTSLCDEKDREEIKKEWIKKYLETSILSYSLERGFIAMPHDHLDGTNYFEQEWQSLELFVITNEFLF